MGLKPFQGQIEWSPAAEWSHPETSADWKTKREEECDYWISQRVNPVGKFTVGRVHRCRSNTDTVSAECKVAKHSLTGKAAVLTISVGLARFLCVYCCSWTLCRCFLANNPVVFPDLFGSFLLSVVTAVSLKKLKLGDVAYTGQAGGVEAPITCCKDFQHLKSLLTSDAGRVNRGSPWVWRVLLFYVFPNLKKCSTQPIPPSVISIHLCRPADAPREKHNRIWVAINSEWLLSLVNLLLTRFRGQRPICQVSRLRH